MGKYQRSSISASESFVYTLNNGRQLSLQFAATFHISKDTVIKLYRKAVILCGVCMTGIDGATRTIALAGDATAMKEIY